jgi:BAH domain
LLIFAGEMMLSLLWYYRPEHTEQGRQPNHMADEIFASKHKDHSSVACIEDKCYVLTFNEYCRYERQTYAELAEAGVIVVFFFLDTGRKPSRSRLVSHPELRLFLIKPQTTHRPSAGTGNQPAWQRPSWSSSAGASTTSAANAC